MFQDKWSMIGSPIAQQALRIGDYALIRISTQPKEGAQGFGLSNLHKWLILRWQPALELVAEWEVPLEAGKAYTGFTIAPDSSALIAYEAERGEFHRLPFPPDFMK